MWRNDWKSYNEISLFTQAYFTKLTTIHESKNYRTLILCCIVLDFNWSLWQEIVVITFQFSFFIRRQTKIQITNHPLWREADNFSQHFWSSLFVGNPPNSLNIMKLPKNMAKIGHNLYFSLQATIIILISKQNEGMHVF